MADRSTGTARRTLADRIDAGALAQASPDPAGMELVVAPGGHGAIDQAE